MFRYRDKVKIKEGFYRGYEGTLVGCELIDLASTKSRYDYEVEILTHYSGVLATIKKIKVLLPEEYFEKIEE